MNTAITALLLLACLPSVYSQCSQPDDILGCIACAASSYLVLNTSTATYTCSSIADCIVIDADGLCLQCGQGKTLNSTNGTTSCTAAAPGCKLIQGNSCVECYGTDYYLDSSTGQCVLNNIDYCWRANLSACLQCSDHNILTTSSCSVGAQYCASFDYETWQCLACPNSSYLLHPSATFCYMPVTGCLVYKIGECLQCQSGYYLASNACQQGYITNLYLQVLPNSYYLTSSSLSSALEAICLNHSQYFANNTCSQLTSGVAYCLVTTGSICSQCLPHFYLDSSSACQPCSLFANCLVCSQYNCEQCIPSYYLAVDLPISSTIYEFFNGNLTTAASSQCLPCAIMGCLQCRNRFNDDNINQVLCDSCLFGYKLYNYTCYSCPDSTYLDLNTKRCLPCNISNCMYCNTDPNTCDQCSQDYYYSNGTCLNLTLFLTAPVLTAGNVFEVLNKSLPSSSTYITNDQILLITSCVYESNGYVCYCPQATNTTYTSLCHTIDPNLAALNLSIPSLLNLNSTTISKTQFIEHRRTLLLLSELPQFVFNQDNSSSILLSQEELGNYLQIQANYLRNHPSQMSSTAFNLAAFILTNQYYALSPTQSTVMAGPGYYLKYLPASPTQDDTSVVSLTSSSPYTVLIFYNSTRNPDDIIGTVYLFNSLLLNTSTTLTLKIKKINFLDNDQAYQVRINGAARTLSTSSDSEGYLTISNVPTSIQSAQYAITVAAVTSSTLETYSSQRIENIIYRDAFIYILVVIALYLIFLPMCALVDCVDNKAFKRRLRKDDESYHGVRKNTQSVEEESREPGASSQERGEKIFNINYKDFFPIYNIANTQRPRRLVKLCLFIVNLQHSITFLSLVYFHLNEGQPLVAVLLAIPAYILCIIMGYICGAIVINLPGRTKYLINLLSLAYWIIWVVVMDRFWSNDYKPYIYVFFCIFFVLDMVFDLLQTLLMYFTIKQQTRQIRMFRALAKWFSYRGFYEFNEMARDLQEARDN